MKAKELRVGNLIYDTLFKTNCVVDIKTLSMIELEPKTKRFKPVKIEEKLLDRFMFVKNHFWVYVMITGGLQIIESEGFWYPYVFMYSEMSHEEEQCVSLERIEYVHELQNLFYAIYKQELDLK